MIKKIISDGIIEICLMILALVLRFIMVGYDFIAYTFLLIAALIFAYRHLSSTPRKILTVVLLIGIVYLIIIEVPIISASKGDSNSQSDYLIVLGAGVNGTEPSLSLYNRLTAAKSYLDNNPSATVIVSGGKGKGEDITEAECMKLWLEKNGISSRRIIIEDESTNTRQNFENSFAIISSRGDNPNGCTVISSEYHLYRASLIARMQGVEIKTVPAHTSYPVIMINYYIREAFAVTALLLFS